MNNTRFFVSDFVEIQRNSFNSFLEKGIISEITHRNPIYVRRDNVNIIEIRFYPEYYRLTTPIHTVEKAIRGGKSYRSEFYLPVQLTEYELGNECPKTTIDLTTNLSSQLICPVSLIPKEISHSPELVMNMSLKESSGLKRKRACFQWLNICQLPLMTKRGHFIINGSPRVIVNQVLRSPGIYFQQKEYQTFSDQWTFKPKEVLMRYYTDIICFRGTWLRIAVDRKNRMWAQTKRQPKIPLYCLLLAMGLTLRQLSNSLSNPERIFENFPEDFPRIETPPEAWELICEIQNLHNSLNSNKVKSEDSMESSVQKRTNDQSLVRSQGLRVGTCALNRSSTESSNQLEKMEKGRQWVFNKFMNPRTYELRKQGRTNINKKFKLNIPFDLQTLTVQDLLATTEYLIQIEKGLKTVDNIDHLKNRRVRTVGELIQVQFGIGLLRFEKYIRSSLNLRNTSDIGKPDDITKMFSNSEKSFAKPVNGALREFFGTSPLSQLMDQMNPLAELTHKRRLTSLGPGGVSRDNATLDIRGIHPSHYGRICPIETPEGKNTGLVNSITTYAFVNETGTIETPYFRMYKGQIQKEAGYYYLTAEKEDLLTLAAGDVGKSTVNFFPKNNIPIRQGPRFTKIPAKEVQYIAISAIQMIAVAASLIPFLEHDDANRALMGSNMQRQSVPLLRPTRPIVATGLESKVIADSGHVLQAKQSGIVTHVSGSCIQLHCLKRPIYQS
jgi:DNA-directed RNA polymerase subunit beta